MKHLQSGGVDLHSIDAGLREVIVDEEGEAAPAQAHHQQCQWSLCNKGITRHYTICSLESSVVASGGQKRESDCWRCPGIQSEGSGLPVSPQKFES